MSKRQLLAFDTLDTNLLCQKLKLSRGEICVANFIPPANGARQGIIYWQKCDFSLKHLTLNSKKVGYLSKMSVLKQQWVKKIFAQREQIKL